MIIGMVAMALLVVLSKFTGYFQYKYMKVQSALENTIQKKSSTKSVKFSGNEIFEPRTDRTVANRGYEG